MKTATSKKASVQILSASLAGTAAFRRGASSAPCQDTEFSATFSAMIDGRQVGETPDGEASTIEILQAWTSSWHAANLAAVV